MYKLADLIDAYKSDEDKTEYVEMKDVNDINSDLLSKRTTVRGTHAQQMMNCMSLIELAMATGPERTSRTWSKSANLNSRSAWKHPLTS